jgi:nucleoside-diphosphate-sugar epimerase
VQFWHALAKTLSEKTAWALAMDRGVDMVAINAGLITGPGLSNAHPYLKGAVDMYQDGVLVTVDADFLADAHVAAYECPTAYGRYLCFNNAVCRPEDAVKFAHMVSPSAPRSLPRYTYLISSSYSPTFTLHYCILRFKFSISSSFSTPKVQ